MGSLPALELLESMHSFPGRYTFKVIGREDMEFEVRVLAAVRTELSEDADPQLSSRRTANGRHIAVTVEPELESAQQVLNIYERLQQLEGLVLLL